MNFELLDIKWAQEWVIRFIETTNKCWKWSHRTNTKGRPVLSYKGIPYLVHRLLWMYRNGSVPLGLELDHVCNHKWCINPDCLEPVTRLVNRRRAAALITHCPYGHEYTKENTYRDPPRKKWVSGRRCRICRRRVLDENANI